jgi:phosphoglucosamine mutase
MGRLFGTDGIRGLANKELTPQLAMSVGNAVAEILNRKGRVRVAVGGDTRRSTDMLISAVSAGLCSGGADAIILGTVTTPEAAYLGRSLCADATVMISASHNPSEYNGIKIFNSSGYKLADELEEKIEALIYSTNVYRNVGRIENPKKTEKDYIFYLKSAFNTELTGLKVVVDCANGSASGVAPNVFSELGADVTVINATPNGDNINLNCGSTHIEGLIESVKREKADIGFAFDGDADRCLCVDELGNIIDGDCILAICALDMQKRCRLKNSTVVGTVMTNFGFLEFCKKNSINFKATKVGDRYVLEEMLMGGYSLGGEQSGHIIFSEHATTGDGILTALAIASLVKKNDIPLSILGSVMERYPQELINVKVSPETKVRFYTDPIISQAIKEAENHLGESGRIVVRASGTEPLIRVMAEGKNFVQIKSTASYIADIIRKRLI